MTFRSELVASVFAAHEGSYAATQKLHQLVECREDTLLTVELSQQLGGTYELLISLTQLRHDSNDEAVLAFVSTKGAVATRENYEECVNLLRFYGFSLLIKFVENNWHHVTLELKSRCQRDVERLFSRGAAETTVAAEYNTLVMPKVTQYLATIAIRQWPMEWADVLNVFMDSINSRFALLGTKANSCKQTLAELSMFGGLLSEVSVDISDCMDNKVLHKKRTQILGLLKNCICEVFLLIHRVIILGLLNDQPQMLRMVITIFRNLSISMEGFVFVAFDVDEFLRMHANGPHRSDIIQTMHHICENVVHKPIKNMKKSNDFDISNEALYKNKLGRFLRNLVTIGESMQVDSSLDTACDELHLAQAIKALFDRNGIYILLNVDCEPMKLLSEYLLGRLIMHPSMQVAMCAVTALNVMFRRMYSLGESHLTGEYVAGVFVPNPSARWLDHRRVLLVLFVRCLKIGNAALQQDSADTTSSATMDKFIADAVGTSVLRSHRWSKLLFAYVPIDDEFCVGPLKNFEPRFASLRSAILNCVALLCTMSHDYMNLAIKALADIFTTAQSVVVESPCVIGGSACTLPGISEKQLQWTCKKLVLFDGTCYMFEAALTRLRSATIDSTSSSDNTKTPEWIQPAAANKVLSEAQSKAGGTMVDTWISSALTYLLHMLGLQLPSVHSAQLEIRRLGMLASTSHLLLFNPEPTERILEYVVSLLLVQGPGSDQSNKVCKSALVTLIALCKNCPALVSNYVEPIVQRIRHCLGVAEDESSRDLLLESLVALTSCLQDFETQRRLAHEIVAPHIDEINGLASRLSSVKSEGRPAMLFEILYGNGPSDLTKTVNTGGVHVLGGASTGLFDIDSLDRGRRNLRRAFTMTLSIIRCSVIPNNQGDRNSALMQCYRPRHPLEDLLRELLASICLILGSLCGMWRPAFRGRSAWRKAVLSPGEEEWIALQGFNEAIASEDSLRRLVESVFRIPSNIDSKLVRKCRRHDFLIRQSALKLCGEIFSTAAAHKVDVQVSQERLIAGALVEPLDWVTMFHLAQFLKFTLVPASLSLRPFLPKMITIICERINSEWKALNRVQRNLLESSAGVPTNESAESRILHLYYLRVYACIETGMQLMALVAAALRTQSPSALESELNGGSDEIMMEPVDNLSVFVGCREMLTSLLQCLCSALCWPHCRCVTEALRLLRAYAKIAPSIDKRFVGLAEGLAFEVLVVLHKQIISERTFDPLNFGNDEGQGSTTTAYKRFWSNTRDGSANYIKEFVNTMYSLYECLVRCHPGISRVVVRGEMDVQALFNYGSVINSLKLLTPYLHEQECISFLSKVMAQNSVEARAILQDGIEANILVGFVSCFEDLGLQDQNARANAKLAQLRSSVLETESSKGKFFF
ncbi:uncharacterized protein BXIN_0764 [Babesia sp. Xinjiang]|uniref:uncharacterized protein n=1 Tax=Babesia sp. Xinjiang TaxID=462227 RepID=UPI000A233B08|nr:uncharacterized protein BXIN_0764 [Babesia sp. Xinjiang]ORM41356.1 hypothetical protein BXIN_0764 [Babesia sp. Xinjiang]